MEKTKLYNKKYYIEKIDRTELEKYGFKYSYEKNTYSIIFPLDKYKKYIVLYGKITISNDTKDVTVDVYSENGNYYHHFYNSDNSQEGYLKLIYKKINKRFAKYGIKEKEFERKNKKYGKFNGKKNIR